MTLAPVGSDLKHSYEWQQISGLPCLGQTWPGITIFVIRPSTGVVLPVKLSEASEYLPVVSAVTLLSCKSGV